MEAPRVESELVVPAELVAVLPDRLREAQPAFAATGGLHATGLFSIRAESSSSSGRTWAATTPWTRSSAGRSARGSFRSRTSVLCVSGRLSFELVQKAAVAGCPVVVAVGAPSTLAVDLARDRGVTLCGFVRGGRVNVYSEPQRIG